MPRYSVAVTKDKLSSLIDKALAGEEVIVTRRGKPAVELRAVTVANAPTRSKEEWLAWLRKRREQRPALDTSAADLIRQMRDESAH